jgi:hypothetical protein
LRARNHGDPIVVTATVLGVTGRWLEPFLVANEPALPRLDVRHEIRGYPELSVVLTPGARIGAVPLIRPDARRAAVGLLVEPRFAWPAIGAVFDALGFTVPPTLGGGPLVPGSAREVPPWVLAGPIIERLAALLFHRRRGIVERHETRASPRGRVDWTRWASAHVARGAWRSFPCRFTEPDDDPDLIASVRWKLARLEEGLAIVAWSPPARHLLGRAAELRLAVGPGASRRPATSFPRAESGWVGAALEAISLGRRGARPRRRSHPRRPRLGPLHRRRLGSLGRRRRRRPRPPPRPRGHPVPGSPPPPLNWAGWRGPDRVIWLDAKYKRHFALLARRGWSGLDDRVRDEHRADLHQALAYAALADAPQVDTVLVYPDEAREGHRPAAVATVTTGRRRVRLVLASVPFGFRGVEEKEGCLRGLREVLAA